MRARAGLLTVLSLLLAWPTEGRLDRVANAFKGQVVILEKRPPTRFPNDAAFVKFLKGKRKKHLWPDKSDQNQWTIEYMAFFREAPRDVEVKMKIFDSTEGRRFVEGDSVYLAERGQRILSSSLVLKKPPFKVNRQYTIFLLNSRNVVLASTVFWLRGKGEVYSGKVTFTDEDTKAKDED
ncbi:MAG: hypothetical protein IT371_02955 [Deltaproteobacteria bacterium]|nr:hypothetical protein [Deltaproteobacteria bacterium]